MRFLLGLLSLLAVVVGVALLVARHERFEWSTDSPRAVAELEAGLEAAGKLYEDDAIEHLEAALAADPDFAAAQLYLVFHLSRRDDQDPRRIHELLQELEGHDLAELRPRERTLVEFFLARAAGREEAGAILEGYLAEHPDDPYVLDFQCIELAYSAGGDDQAESCLRRLIEVDPNRVAAQNLLAYMAMNQGHFAEAEEQFEIYRFLAPDQANPHDSMGELLMVTGRYDEAEDELRRAVELKRDFCPSWQNLVRVELLRSDFAAARRVVDDARAAGACTDADLQRLECTADLWELAAAGDWEAAWERLGPCGLHVSVGAAQEAKAAGAEAEAEVGGLDLERDGEASTPGVVGDARVSDEVRGDLALATFATVAALETGRHAEARAILRAAAGGDDVAERELNPLARHLAGIVALATGDPARGAELLGQLDQRLLWGGGMGIWKLFNRLHLAAAEAAAGDAAAAEATMAALAEVNRPFANDPPLPPLHTVPAPPPLHAVPAPPPSPIAPSPPTGDTP